MKRRDFIYLMGLFFAGCTNAKELNQKRDKKVLIVGAGVAGLKVAQDLQNNGFEVLVLEARNYIGGRIRTTNSFDEISLDMGATWIHGFEGNPIGKLAVSIDAKLLSTSYDNSITYNSNEEVLTQSQESLVLRFTDMIYDKLEEIKELKNDISVKSAMENLLNKYEKNSFEYSLINFILSSEFEQEYSGSIEELSSKYYDESEEFGGEDKLFVDGYRVIIDYLSKNIDIKIHEKVNYIDSTKNTVLIKTLNNSYEADYVVVTTPLGVLKQNDIVFNPKLSAKKQKAIDSLGMGVLNKCYLEFERVFWDEEVDWIEYIAKDDDFRNFTQWVSFYNSTKKPILLAFSAGNKALKMESLSDEEIINNALKVLKKIYKTSLPKLVKYEISRWGRDEFSKGSYSYNKLGSTPSMRDDLAMVENSKVFFAGEATSKDYFGTVHGAYLSAQKIVNKIIKM